MNFIFKLVFIVVVYGVGFYMGRNYEGGDDHVEDTLEHLKDLQKKGVKQGKKIIENLKEE